MDYFTEIANTFIRRYGKNMLLAPQEWALIEKWKEMGVPLEVVVQGIESSFDSHEANQKINSLTYCRRDVEAQFAKWLEEQKAGEREMASEK